MSSILKQLEQYTEAAKVSAELSNMITAHQISQMMGTKKQSVKDLLKDKDIKPVGRLGAEPFYSKAEVLHLIKESVKQTA